jgi:hypothetical protein
MAKLLIFRPLPTGEGKIPAKLAPSSFKREGMTPYPATNRSTNICSAGTPEAKASFWPWSIIAAGPHR